VIPKEESMGLKSMSLLAGATISASGGTPIEFAEDGVSINGGLHLMIPEDGDYTTRRQATVKYRPPTLNATTGVYGKDKKSISLTLPLVLASGKIVFNTIRLEREVHPELDSDVAHQLNLIGAQLLISSDAGNFWAYGSLS